MKQPFLFDLVWKMFKPFVREKLRKRMFFHGSKMNSLHTHMAPSHLPANYGGSLPEIDYTAAEWFPEFMNCENSIKGINNPFQFAHNKKFLNCIHSVKVNLSLMKVATANSFLRNFQGSEINCSLH